MTGRCRAGERDHRACRTLSQQLHFRSGIDKSLSSKKVGCDKTRGCKGLQPSFPGRMPCEGFEGYYPLDADPWPRLVDIYREVY